VAQCDVCGKTSQFGHNVSHSKRRTNRTWAPNIHKQTVLLAGRSRKVYICTRCLRTQSKLPR